MKKRVTALFLALLLALAPMTPALAADGDFAISNGVLLEYYGSDADVVIPAGVTTIQNGAFFENKIIRSVVIPEGVVTIAPGAFYLCTNLQRVQLPSTLRNLSIKKNTHDTTGSFEFCESLTEVNLPEGLETIGYRCFAVCSKLSKVSLPSTLKTLGDGAFFNTSSLTSIALPEGLETIGEQALSAPWGSETGLSSITIPSTVHTIGRAAFYGQPLVDVVIPETVTNLDTQQLFMTCAKLRSVTLPSHVTELGEDMFAYSSLESLNIPAGVTKIGRRAFETCGNLSKIDIPAGVTEIGDYALSGTAITTISLPAGLKTIGDGAFHLCKSLTGVTIPNGVTSVGMYAFRFNSSLTSAVIPESVTELGKEAFAECTALANVTVPARFSDRYSEIFKGAPWLNQAIGDFDVQNGVLVKYMGAGGSVVVPEGVTEIASKAFKGAPHIVDLKLPESLKKIDAEAFRDASIGEETYQGKRVDLYIPAGVESIGEMAFSLGINVWFCGDKPAVTPGSFYSDKLYIPAHAKGWEAFYQWWPSWDPAYAVSTSILVDGRPVAFDAYALKDAAGNDTTYLKLRDVAAVLDGTAAQFDVGWDGAISLTSGASYVSRNGTEGETPFAGNHPYAAGAGAVKVDGAEKALDAITLTDNAGKGYTYFKLRDLGAALGFDVTWNGSAIEIHTDKPYSGT